MEIPSATDVNKTKGKPLTIPGLKKFRPGLDAPWKYCSFDGCGFFGLGAL
jgi:hypothetical protein